MREESTTTVALRRGAETVSVCRCVGTRIDQPGGCFTCGKPRHAPKRPKDRAVQHYVPPERQTRRKRYVPPKPEPDRLPLHLRDVGEYLGRSV